MLMSKKTGASILEYARPSRGTQIINKITNKYKTCGWQHRK
ncbi:hypothetical protein RintRC_3276 [Richelia intracellularis]|nr:hypothetical protein RintRC_3276 [Richelia intracellularis]